MKKLKYSKKAIAKRNISCFRCGTKLKKSFTDDYTYYCPYCDEDFYRFEQEDRNK